MNTKILDAINDKYNSINTAVNILKQGGIIAFPTETIYGIGANIFDLNAINNIFILKKRDFSKPLAAHVSNLKQIESICTELNDDFYTLFYQFLPGPLSIIVKSNNSIPNIVNNNSNTIAIRMPNNLIALELINSFQYPIAATSANISGQFFLNSPEDIFVNFKGKINAIINGGKTLYEQESTIISLVSPIPTMLRNGVITKENIENTLNKKIISIF